jgi:hypothetical protein
VFGTAVQDTVFWTAIKAVFSHTLL